MQLLLLNECTVPRYGPVITHVYSTCCSPDISMASMLKSLNKKKMEIMLNIIMVFHKNYCNTESMYMYVYTVCEFLNLTISLLDRPKLAHLLFYSV